MPMIDIRPRRLGENVRINVAHLSFSGTYVTSESINEAGEIQVPRKQG